MALPASGAISLNNVNVELGLSGTTLISMNQASVRGLFGKASGAIRMNDGYGKANEFSFSITSNQTNANLRTLALAAGWTGSAKVYATINAGVYVYSTDNTVAGLTIDGSWPGGVTLTNNGYIMGMGGGGNRIATSIGGGGPYGDGGPAISLGVNATIINGSGAYIAGGGGGGMPEYGYMGSGGGAGGGTGGAAYGGNRAAGGGPGSAGALGVGVGAVIGKYPGAYYGAGGGGGRILPGTGGLRGYRDICGETQYNGSGGGSGGGGGITTNGAINPAWQVYGGNGGDGNNAGQNSTQGPGYPGNPNSPSYAGSGGGGWGAVGGRTAVYPAGYQNPGGKAIALNGYTATRSGSGTTYGTVG